MSTISASTTSTTGFKVTSDTTGTLVFQTGASPTTAMTLGSDQSVTFAGTPTYSGGTANGVAYLNGSKVFTTGTALVFDGTNLGVGTTSPTGGANRVVDVYGSGSSAINFHNATSGTTSTDGGVVGQYGSDLVLYNYEAGIIQFGTSNTERARIDSSGNLGVGTTSPAQKLDVNGVAKASNYYYQSSASAYATPSSTTLTMTSTTEGSLFLISASNHSGTTNVSHTMWMLSYSGNGGYVVTQIATGGNYTPTIAVSGSTVTLTNNSGGARIIYASFIRLL